MLATKLYVNGGLVAADLGGNAAHQDYPVNHWLRNGSNEIQLYLHKTSAQCGSLRGQGRLESQRLRRREGP